METKRLGRLLLDRQAGVSFDYKPDGTILSELDEAVQHAIHDCLRALPDPSLRNAHFVAEERMADGGWMQRLEPGSWNWVVDAIDGTAAFTKGFNVFSISIALLDGQFNPLIGLIHAPGLAGRFDLVSTHAGRLERYAVRMTARGVSLKPVAQTSAPPAGWPDPAAVRRSYCYGSSDMHRLLSRFPGKVRNLGATATHLALLADRSVDPAAVLLSRCNSWDVAAGLGLADAAGLEIRPLGDRAPMTPGEALGNRGGLPLPLLVGHPAVLDTIQACESAD